MLLQHRFRDEHEQALAEPNAGVRRSLDEFRGQQSQLQLFPPLN